MPCKLSVNVNKIALLRNSRGSNIPNVVSFAIDCQQYGADGITIHPRPDERHIRKTDVYELAEHFPNQNCEYNIEGFPSDDFVKMVCQVKPTQVTLVPDGDKQLTSDHGWDVIKNKSLLTTVLQEFRKHGIRTSLFIDPIENQLQEAKNVGTDRIEFYTGPYAHSYVNNKEKAISPIKKVIPLVHKLCLGINAGHDLNLDNLQYFNQQIDGLLEVSIGHALVKDCLYLGIENTINMYKRLLK